jgi:deoxycytidylate deaminase
MITSRDIRYYELALKVARNSDCPSKHGAVIVRGGNVLSLACNRNVSHPVTVRHKPFATSIHAEQRALVLAQTDCRYATLYSARANGYHIGRPCAMCAELMRDVGINSVVFFDGQTLMKERLA